MAEPLLEALRSWKNSWWPTSVSTSSGLGIDKFVHLILFAVCAILACRAWQSILGITTVLVSLLIFAGLTEIAQHFIPGRSMSFGDMVADATGILAGIVIWNGYRLSQLTDDNSLQ